MSLILNKSVILHVAARSVSNKLHITTCIPPLLKHALHTSCSLQRKHTAISDLSKRSLADVDITSLRVKYDRVPDAVLHDLDSRVKKTLTVEYGKEQDVCDAAVRMLLQECGFTEKGEDSPERSLIKITVKIWHLRNLYRARKTRHNFYERIVRLVDVRRDLLDHVRTYNFENYYRIMTVLNHHHYFRPEVFMVKSPLADNVKEMKIRAYAHSLDVAQKEAEKQNYFNELKEKFLQELKAKELAAGQDTPATTSISSNDIDTDSRSFG